MSETRYIISDAAKMIDVEPHVLRYWEEELGMDIPRNEMGHRYYTDKEVKLFGTVRDLKEKGFQLKAIKMILSTISSQVPEDNNIISLDEVRKNYNEEDIQKDTKEDGGLEAAAPAQDKPASEDTRIAKADEDTELKKTIQAISSEDKMKHFKYIMDGIMMQALRKNNQSLEADLVNSISEKVIKEMDYLFRVQEEKEEERYRNIDEMIRKKQKGRKEAAASKVPPYGPGKQKRGLFKNRGF